LERPISWPVLVQPGPALVQPELVQPELVQPVREQVRPGLVRLGPPVLMPQARRS